MSRLRGAGGSWSHKQLGRSLPLYRPLWISRLTLAGLTLVSGLLLLSFACRSLDPKTAPLEPAQADRLVTERLAKLAGNGIRPGEITPWAPGPPLSETEAPGWMESPPPPLWRGPHPDERSLRGQAADLAAQARRDLAAGDPQAAATRFLRAAGQQDTWETRFGAGSSLLAAGDSRRALRELEKANERLDALEKRGADGPTHFAARISTFHAAGLAALEARECILAIQQLRLAVRYLGRYVGAEGALVYDRKLPFRVREAGVDNHAVWTTLARAYAECGGEFPESYPPELGEQTFTGEYATADLEEIEEGPFPEGLAACVAASPRPESVCWALSNLNKVLWSSRSYLPREDGDGQESRLDDDLAGSLARLTYDAAWLAAVSEHEEDRRRAGRWLTYAARLDRRAGVPSLDERIAELGRFLAPRTGDYSFLAEPWRRRDLDGITLEAGRPPEELKGLAWALSEGWLARLGRRDPAGMISEAEAQILRAGPWGESLGEWKRGAQRTMQETLAEEIRIHHRNDNLPAALAIRDFRAGWLGEGWPSRGRDAWVSAGMIAGWVGLAALWLGLTAAFWLIHRLVVFPYLVYTTDAYRLEHQRRHARRRAEGKPFTREEIEGRG